MPELQSIEFVATWKSNGCVKSAALYATAQLTCSNSACRVQWWHFACLYEGVEDPMDKDKPSLDDPLGIADAPVPTDANDFHATNDPDEVARRRARARGETEPEVRGPGDDVNDDGFGATSIDMGYGGEGNAIRKNK
jgi:hypothetical protein